MDLYTSVLDRYSEGAKEQQASLCCPIDYDKSMLADLPREIIEKDYGCGDPSRYVKEGDTVLDLGSGGGKICYMAAKLVGEKGRVIGVDMNDDMLALARKYQGEMAAKIGSDRVTFLKGFIQDLALDVDAMETVLRDLPVDSASRYIALQDWQHKQRIERPLVADNSVDLVISNCVLNLVDDAAKDQLVREIFRVLKPGGRVAISDIISDDAIPAHLKKDPALWSGCISGAFQEQEFLKSFIHAGFVAAAYDKWEAQPWQVIEDIEFRSVTLVAVKPEGTECIDRGHAVIYKGPFAYVHDDDGHIFYRGERMAVCERTFRMLTQGPYRESFIGVAPAQLWEPRMWCAPAGTRRAAKETKGGEHVSNCGTEGCC